MQDQILLPFFVQLTENEKPYRNFMQDNTTAHTTDKTTTTLA